MREVFRSVLEIEFISLYYKDFTLIICNPLVISFVKIAQIFDADALFIVTSTFLDL